MREIILIFLYKIGKIEKLSLIFKGKRKYYNLKVRGKGIEWGVGGNE